MHAPRDAAGVGFVIEGSVRAPRDSRSVAGADGHNASPPSRATREPALTGSENLRVTGAMVWLRILVLSIIGTRVQVRHWSTAVWLALPLGRSSKTIR